MRGGKLIPDRAGCAEVALTQLGQEVTISTQDCDTAIPNEHTRVSRTHAVVKVVCRAHVDCNTRHVRNAREGCISHGRRLASS